MAHIYVDSAAAGAGTGASWANAYLTLEAAAEAAGTAAGDSIWVAHTHAESTAAAVTIVSKNTAAVPGTIMCVNKAGSVPPVSADLRTTATITTTGNSALSIGGYAHVYGITFSAGDGAVTADLVVGVTSSGFLYFKSCSMRRGGTSGGQINVAGGSISTFAVFDNTTVAFANVADSITVTTAKFLWKNTASAVAGAVFPTTLIIGDNAVDIEVSGVDLSAMSTGKTLYSTASDAVGPVLFKNCKTDANVTLSAAPLSNARVTPIFINCDSGDTNYNVFKYAYSGTQSVETSSVLTDGASDGTTPVSWKLATNANSKLLHPFESLPIFIWNEVVGAVTVTVQGTWDSGGPLPTNAQIWMEVEYLGNSGSTQSSFASSGLADVLATPANLAAGDGTWAGPASAYTKFKMTKALTVAEKGPISAKIYVTTPSVAFYVDPRIVLS